MQKEAEKGVIEQRDDCNKQESVFGRQVVEVQVLERRIDS
jgi:hypothetical protein